MLFIVKYAVSHENNYELAVRLWPDQPVNQSMEITSQLQHIFWGEKHTNILNIHKILKMKIWQIFHISEVVRRRDIITYCISSSV